MRGISHIVSSEGVNPHIMRMGGPSAGFYWLVEAAACGCVPLTNSNRAGAIKIASAQADPNNTPGPEATLCYTFFEESANVPSSVSPRASFPISQPLYVSENQMVVIEVHFESAGGAITYFWANLQYNELSLNTTRPSSQVKSAIYA